MKVLIIGCGWVGEAFAKKMLTLGHEVYATTTKEEKYHRLKDDGIFVIKADFDKKIDMKVFPKDVDFILNSVPAVKRLQKEDLLGRFEQLRTVLLNIKYKKQIFLSSIGIYPDKDGDFYEDSEVEEGNLYAAELMMMKLDNTLVYRLGGLFGNERIFAKYFENKVCYTGEQLANFVHLEDVVELLFKGQQQDMKEKVYNVVAPKHPLKRDVVEVSAEKYGYLKPLKYENREVFYKKVNSDRIVKELTYTFKYLCPLSF
ncbi:NAD-dependent epimerase/dehydratase family protein [Sphingobacterium sp. UT-1RO-CII-1]|uniref:NAD-dependent epimerase/dehydratase family protein n=1 Tax=Sphingobacterium sp. UT-1RO-CII-1 TaxID=2995225 RepID=UPI00227CDD8A|nr:NAD-dependent epimerase/dehydratase family protein [Sphingobacterium sp. UT-1RO-CII-1]MCY4779455.1 NAD-dependent epimerase/dehydratase family protein [Sphingobacterium sp. UT-1RO-CII-1]